MNPAISPIEQDKEWMPKEAWLERHQDHLAVRDSFTQNNTQPHIIFVGDSITQGWGGAGLSAFEKHFKNLGCANYGIGGDATEHLLWRLRHGILEGLAPKYFSLLIGTNNLGNEGHSPAQTIEGIHTVFAELQLQCPDAHIILNAVFPRGERPDNAFRAQIAKINQNIIQLSQADNVTWLDMTSKFLNEEKIISANIMPDHLHLSEEAYHIWAKELIKFV